MALLLIDAITLVSDWLHRSGDPKFFDWVPVPYFFEVMDIAILGCSLHTERSRQFGLSGTKQLSAADFRLPGPRHVVTMLAVYVGVATGAGLAFLLGIVVVAEPVLSGLIILSLIGLALCLRLKLRLRFSTFRRGGPDPSVSVDVRFGRSSSRVNGTETRGQSAE